MCVGGPLQFYDLWSKDLSHNPVAILVKNKTHNGKAAVCSDIHKKNLPLIFFAEINFYIHVPTFACSLRLVLCGVTFTLGSTSDRLSLSYLFESASQIFFSILPLNRFELPPVHLVSGRYPRYAEAQSELSLTASRFLF